MSSHEAQRIQHGMWWGAAATAAAGIVVLGMMALHLWPPGRPLSVLMVQWVGREYLGREGATAATWLLAGVLQVSAGALWGGLLTLVTERATWAEIFGLGALRWFATNVLVAPTLGWGDFGFLHLPTFALATMLPHLGWTLSVGWLVRQEDQGHAPIPLHLHWPHLRWSVAGRKR